MKKKGFTLVELLAVIVILSIILLTTVPTLINNIKNRKVSASERVYELIQTAAKNYEIDNDINEVKALPITDLCGRYIACPIIDPSTNEEIDGYITIGKDEYEILGEVTFQVEYNGGGSSQVFEDTYIPYTTITMETPTKAKNEFGGWQIVKGNGTVNGNNITIGNRDMIVYALWNAWPTLTVNLNGGNSSQTFESVYKSGTVITLETPTKTGHTLAGWNVSGEGSVVSGNKFTMGIGNTTLTANWQTNTYQIIYELNGGTKGTNAPSSGTYGSTVSVSNPTRTGYTFNGWSVSGTGASLNGTNLTIGTSNITLTAKWTANTYTISYNLNGGTLGTNSPTSVTYGTTITLVNPTRTGYTFTGWTASTGMVSGTSFTPAASNTTLTANWKANTNTPYKVQHWKQTLTGGSTQNSTNYTLDTTDNLTGTTGASVTPSRKTYTGFTSPSSKTVTIAANGSTVVNYYYTRNSYTVTLNKGTGITSVTGAGTYKYGASVTINAYFTSDYAWSKWTGTHNTTTRNYTFTMPAYNVTDTANAVENIIYANFTVTDSNRSMVGYTGVSGENLVIPSTFKSGNIIYTVVKIGEGAFYGTNIASVTIPDTVTTIERYAFANCIKLTSINFGNGVTSIGSSAFEYCTSLPSVTIPGNVKTIGVAAFTGCTSLKTVIIREGVTYIGNCAFQDCTILASIYLPKTITSVGGNPFLRELDNSYLKNVYYSGTTSQWNSISGETYCKWGWEEIYSEPTIHYNYSY